MSAELIGAAYELFSNERWYPGAALVRQVVEIEYILFLFSNDPEEADKWISLSPNEAKKYFMPAEMRKRSGDEFDSQEYSAHCELGGHPRKKGVILLTDWMMGEEKNDEETIPVALWVDLCQHSIRSWQHFIKAVEAISPANVYPEKITEVSQALNKYEF